MTEAGEKSGDLGEQATSVNLIILHDICVVRYKVNATTLLTKLQKRYCQRIGVDPKALRFVYDGQRLGRKDTPQSRRMCNDDVIEVFQTQTGGDAKILFQQFHI